jgi:hypothetical protein
MFFKAKVVPVPKHPTHDGGKDARILNCALYADERPASCSIRKDGIYHKWIYLLAFVMVSKLT